MRESVLRAHGVVLILLSILIGCESNPELTANHVEPIQPLLPAEAGPFSPSMAKLAPGTDYDLSNHAEIKLCESCHPEHTTQWRESTHALSSFNNPFYQVSFESYVQDVGHDKGAFCGGCHDPTLVFTGKINEPIQAETRENYLGITCMSCHGIVEASHDGVASYTLIKFKI